MSDVDGFSQPLAKAQQCLLQRSVSAAANFAMDTQRSAVAVHSFSLDSNVLLAGGAPWESRGDSRYSDAGPVGTTRHRSGILHELLRNHGVPIAITCGLVLAMLVSYFMLGRSRQAGQTTRKKGFGVTFHVLMTCICGFVRGYGLYVIGPFLTPVQRELGLCFPCAGGESDLALAACSCPMKEFAVSSVALGAIFGGLAGGFMADAIGRRVTIMISDVLFLTSAMMIALSGTGSWTLFFFIGRVLAGVAVGTSGPASHAYICELVPPRCRGQLLTLIELSLIAGVFTVFGSSAYLGDTRWRTAIMFPAIPAAIQLLIFAFFLHESPRWLAAAGRTEEAELVFEALGLQSNSFEPGPENAKHIVNKKMPATCALPSAILDKRPRAGPMAMLIHHRRRVLLAVGCALAHNALGANIVMYYSRDILQLASISNSAGSQISLGFAKALGTAIAFAAVDRCGRRLLLIVGVSGAIFGHLGMAVAFVPGLVEVAPTLAWASLLLFLAAWDLGWASLMSVVISEILPDDVRGVGLGASCSLYWLVSFVQAQTLETLFKSITIAGTFFMYCGASIIGLLFVLIYVPETCGRPLETA